MPAGRTPQGVAHTIEAQPAALLRTDSDSAPSFAGIRQKANPNRLWEEKSMDFNPDDALQYFEGVEYPASKANLISATEGNNAPEALLDRIGTLGRPEFSSLEQVAEELRASPQSG